MDRIKRILLVAPTISGGGAERVVSVLSSALAEIGYQVILVLYKRYENEYALSDKVNVFILPKRNSGEITLFYFIRKFYAFRKIIQKTAPDVLIPFLPYQVEQSFLASRGLNIPMVVTVRNNPQFDTPNEKMRRRRDWIAKHTEAIFVQNEEQKAYFDAKTQKKCFVVPNPISRDILDSNYRPSGSIKRFVTMGRLEEQKNHKLLISAFAEVLKVQSDLILDIYGSGTLKDILQQQIDDLGVGDNVRLCGRTENVTETLMKYDAFVMSSNYEGMPNALMEAMGVGLACISTDCPMGPRHLIGQNERGILVETSNRNQLAGAISFATKNAVELQSRAILGRSFICEHYNPNAIAKLLVSEMERIIKK